MIPIPNLPSTPTLTSMLLRPFLPSLASHNHQNSQMTPPQMAAKPSKDVSLSAATSRSNLITTTKVHVMALDGIVNVNSLFTLALFLGLTWYPTYATLVTDASCVAAGPAVAENLVVFHVYSFSCFLFSSLIALAIKEAIKIIGKDHSFERLGASTAHINLVVLRVGTLFSGFGSVFGCGFLMMALVDLVQIKLGTLACGDLYTLAAVAPLVILVPSALFIFVFLVLYAFTR
ncbi:hypothetical protein K2173_008667 [Erythroxylum novogranatense]|uniref:Maternal effect embryo arrest 60 n=1 Tax=Erythroxylum novogranatense TaxID=1862640 RepID=A0AAV8SKY3_9ROSI|nr:hypothetical protein K2173_008667 [Erythroxylum novogranatense]